jgi:hypothetical protein
MILSALAGVIISELAQALVRENINEPSVVEKTVGWERNTQLLHSVHVLRERA